MSLVTIIVTTKNNERTIDKCLSSIKAQTYQDIEIIVVDNFSDDRTCEISKKFTDKVFQKGKERSEQRNFGIEKSKGNIFIILDSDQYLPTSTVAEGVRLLSTDFQMAAIPEENPEKNTINKVINQERIITSRKKNRDLPRIYLKSYKYYLKKFYFSIFFII